MILGDQFYDDLTELIEKYSGMEITNAEAVGYLMFKVNELMSQNDMTYERMKCCTNCKHLGKSKKSKRCTTCIDGSGRNNINWEIK